MSSEELLIAQNEEIHGSDDASDLIDTIGSGAGDYQLEPELEELVTDDEVSPSMDSRVDRAEYENSAGVLPDLIEDAASFVEDEQLPEVINLSDEENEDHATRSTHFQEIDVIELDSEDEIENLEESYIATETVMTQSPATDQSLDIEEDALVANGGVEITNVDELSDSEIEDLEKHEHALITDTEAHLILKETTSNAASGVSSIPIFINVKGDEFLLVPFFEECQYNLEDMISLFTFDEISDCTLLEFFELLRGNGDLIDAYNFDVEDELCLSIPELSISITEDNVHTRSLKLNDLIEPYISLIRQETSDLKNIPDKMTVLVSMQPRFSTNFRKVVEAVAGGKGYFDIFQPQLHNEQDTDDSVSRKRRRTST